MNISKLIMKSNFTVSARVKFYRTMSRATNERRGVKAIIVLKSMIKIEERRNKNKPTQLSKMFRAIAEKVERGRKFGEAINEFVPAIEAGQIYAAEVSGKISDGFKLALDTAKQQELFSKTFKEALMGPVFNLALAMGVLFVFLKILIPQVANAVPVEVMSPLSLFLLRLAKTFNWWFPILIFVIIFGIVWVAWAMPNYNGRFRKRLDNFPPFSMYKLMIGCSFLLSLTSLMKARTNQVTALETIRKFAKPYLKFRINKILEHTGKNLGEALIVTKLDFPDKDVINELSMASDQGVLTEALPEIVDTLNVDGVDAIKFQANVAAAITKFIAIGILMLLAIGFFNFVRDLQSSLS